MDCRRARFKGMYEVESPVLQPASAIQEIPRVPSRAEFSGEEVRHMHPIHSFFASPDNSGSGSVRSTHHGNFMPASGKFPGEATRSVPSGLSTAMVVYEKYSHDGNVNDEPLSRRDEPPSAICYSASVRE